MAAQADDKALTDRMIQVGHIVGIQVFDHIIVNPKTEDFLSYRDVGLMDELSKSTAWVPKFEQVKRIKQMATEQAVLKTKIAMVKELKKKKINISIISDVSGLSPKEIEKI